MVNLRFEFRTRFNRMGAAMLLILVASLVVVAMVAARACVLLVVPPLAGAYWAVRGVIDSAIALAWYTQRTIRINWED